MTIQQVSLLSTYIRFFPNLAVMMGYFHGDDRKYRNFVYFRVSIGIVYAQYPVGY